MRTLLILAIIFPLFCIGQIFSTHFGPSIYLSEKYIRQHKISCLYFTEAWTYPKKRKPLIVAEYKLVFDTMGTIIKYIYIERERRSVKEFPDSTGMRLDDKTDTAGLKGKDTVIFDKNGNLVKTTFYDYKNYYAYDEQNRLVKAISITPQIGPFVYYMTGITYGNSGMPEKVYGKSGKLNYGSHDTLITHEGSDTFVYKNELLTEVIARNDYPLDKISYSDTWFIEYKEGILSKIEKPVEEGWVEHFSISVQACNND
jgi:hypothetical protein